MNGLPVNNLEEQLARFSATRKVTTNSNPCPKKSFTFKKTLSLGKKHENPISLSNINEKANLNYNSEDLVILDNKSSRSISDESVTKNFGTNDNKKGTDIRSYFGSQEAKKNNRNAFKNDLNTNSKNPFKKPLKPSLIFQKSIQTNGTKENVCSKLDESIEIFSDDDDDFFDTKTQEKKEKTSPKFPIKNVFRKPECENKTSKKSVSNFQNELPTLDQICTGVKTSDTVQRSTSKENIHYGIQSDKLPNSPESLQKAHVSIMVKICDIIANQKELLLKNKDLCNLVDARRKIVEKMSTTGSAHKDIFSPYNELHKTSLKNEENGLSKIDTAKEPDCSLLFNSHLNDQEFDFNDLFLSECNTPFKDNQARTKQEEYNKSSAEGINLTNTFLSECNFPFKSDRLSKCVQSNNCFDQKLDLTNSFFSNCDTPFKHDEPSSKRTSSSSTKSDQSTVSNHNQSFHNSFSKFEAPKSNNISPNAFCKKDESVSIPKALMRDNSFDHNHIFDDTDFCPASAFTQSIQEKFETINLDYSFEAATQGPSTSTNTGFKNSKATNEKVIAGKFYGNQRDDGASAQFKGFNFPFSKDVKQIFENVFGLKKFRHNQLEAINAALLKEDCFVLMPTGGGKSLCYQLPALVSPGVTVVVSPLRSLIMDQVQKLCSLDVPANSLIGDADASSSNQVYYQLSAREPSIKLLYVTPEKISASAKLMSIFESLYARNMLQRFVIDEAHCVSQWGHDFRPDYKKLNVLREKFSKVPMMALTATATQRVRTDILHQLKMKAPKVFLQSFNRPNLKYEVRTKSRGLVEEIIEMIKTKFKNMCGIVYCLSRNDCDNVANFLKKSGIMAASYHAGLKNREEVQEAWINDKFKVICATIAFGMGIDKPDVRFVIHHSVPKSIEGYYQESGRAGRDGEQSWCILYYSYSDVQRIKRMIMHDKANKHSWGTHFDNLFKMVHYCENKTDCRRVWMLGYFGEIFDKNLCSNDPATSCDNCYSKESYVQRDITEDAKAVVKCVSLLVDKRKRQNFTLTYFIDLFKGAKLKKILEAGHNSLELYGRGQNMKRCDIERMLRRLVLDQCLQEDMVINKMDLPVIYIGLGKKAKDLMAGKIKITLAFQKDTVKDPQNIATAVEDKEIQELVERCYNELIEVSKAIALERNMHYTNVINVGALRCMSREMPMTEQDMLAMPHVTHAVYEKYGKRFLEVTERYAAERCVIDAERADKDMLSACAEDIGVWSDSEVASARPTFKKGVKRKASKASGSGRAPKKRKNYFNKNNKAKGNYATYLANKKKNIALSQTRVSARAPGIMPNPRAMQRPTRSFLNTPKVVFT